MLGSSSPAPRTPGWFPLHPGVSRPIGRFTPTRVALSLVDGATKVYPSSHDRGAENSMPNAPGSRSTRSGQTTANCDRSQEFEPDRTSPMELDDRCVGFRQTTTSAAGYAVPATPRSQCPYCYSYLVEALRHALRISTDADFFRCKDCRRMWSVPSGQEGPPDPPPKRES